MFSSFGWGASLVLAPLFLIFVYLIIKSRYKKAGPDEALIVYGRGKLIGKGVIGEEGESMGYRIVRGGGTFIVPAWEDYERLSLKIMTLEMNLPHVYTGQGIPINVRAVAQVKVKGTTDSIRRAAGSFLGVEVKGVQHTIQETVAGHLRGIVGTLTVEQLYRDQKSFQEKIREEAHRDLDGMGFEFKSFVFQRQGGEAFPGRHRDRRRRKAAVAQERFHQGGGRRRRGSVHQGGRDGAQGPGHQHRREGSGAAEARAERHGT